MKIIVDVNKITLDEKDKLNAGEYNIHEAQFEFSEEYDSLVKKATFSTKDHSYLVELTNDTCIIPYEVLEETGDFSIGAFGYDTNGDELVLRYSPSPTYVHVDLGSYREDFDNYHVPTADVIEQLTKRIEEAEETIQGYDERLTTAEDKLETVENGAQVNIIEDIKVNGESQTVTEKSVDIDVPTKTSDITNDSGYIDKTVNNLDNYTLSSELSTVATSGSYTDLLNKPDLTIYATNTALETEIGNRQASDNNLQTQIDAITSSTDVVDVVGTYQELQEYDTSKLTDKDVIKVLQDSTHSNALSYYRWIKSSSSWNYLGSEGPFYTKGETDTLLNAKQNTIDSSHKLNADYIDDTLTTNKFVTSSDKSNWNSKYDKPNTGIPKSDLSSGVQTSLGKADTALQEHQDISGKEDKSNKVTSISSSSTNTQYPSAKLLYDKLEEISNDLYNNATVEQEGESITLDNTGESILKLDLKGNTGQDTTTGKNLLPNTATSISSNGITFTVNEDKSVKIKGTATAKATLVLNATQKQFSAGTYRLSTGQSAITSGFDLGISLNGYKTTKTSTTITLDSETTFYQWYIDVYTGTVIDTTLYPMLRLNSIVDETYEPYTNGASPNPDYPQVIHTITGNNKVKSENGKNIANLVREEGTYIGSGTQFSENQYFPNITYEGNIGTGSISLTSATNNSIVVKARYVQGIGFPRKCKPNTYYSLQATSTSSNARLYMSFYDATGTFISGSANNTDMTRTLLSPNNAYWVVPIFAVFGGALTEVEFTNIMLEESNTINTYQPYQSQTYPIYLPVENLFDKDNVVKVENKILNDSGVEINDNGGAYTKMYIPVQPNTNYTISGLPQYATKRIYFFDSSKQWLSRTSGYTSVSEFTFTTPNNCKYIDIQYVLQDNDFNTYQIELGSKANRYTEYGTTPIELCKIGDYQDYFTKNSGKNLFDKDNSSQLLSVYFSNACVLTTGGNVKTLYISIIGGETYTISKIASSRFRVMETTTQPEIGTTGSNYSANDSGTSITITTTTSAKYLCVFYYNESADTLTEEQIRNSIMIEKGSSASTYEPYGTGQWCKYNAIGKVVLDGSESWTKVGSSVMSGTSRFYNELSDIINGDNDTTNTNIYVISNYFKATYWYDVYVLNTTDKNLITNYNSNNFLHRIYLRTDDNIANDVATLQTWLSTHNTTVYYVLATPYLSLIEDETLIEQLDNLENAMSYEGTTNIGQVNNDKAFIISATAFKPTIAGEIASLKYENSRLKERVKKLEEEDTL